MMSSDNGLEVKIVELLFFSVDMNLKCSAM